MLQVFWPRADNGVVLNGTGPYPRRAGCEGRHRAVRAPRLRQGTDGDRRSWRERNRQARQAVVSRH